MKTAEELRHEAAIINGYSCWDEMMISNDLSANDKTGIIDVCMEEYADQKYQQGAVDAQNDAAKYIKHIQI